MARLKIVHTLIFYKFVYPSGFLFETVYSYCNCRRHAVVLCRIPFCAFTASNWYWFLYTECAK